MKEQIRIILSRVMSEEIGKQKAWKKQDEEFQLDGNHRDELIKDILDFMSENSIEVRKDFINKVYNDNI